MTGKLGCGARAGVPSSPFSRLQDDGNAEGVGDYRHEHAAEKPAQGASLDMIFGRSNRRDQPVICAANQGASLSSKPCFRAAVHTYDTKVMKPIVANSLGPGR